MATRTGMPGRSAWGVAWRRAPAALLAVMLASCGGRGSGTASQPCGQSGSTTCAVTDPADAAPADAGPADVSGSSDASGGRDASAGAPDAAAGTDAQTADAAADAADADPADAGTGDAGADAGDADADAGGAPPADDDTDFTAFLANAGRTNFVDDATLVPPLRQLWSVPLDQSVSLPLVVGDDVYVATIANDTMPARLLAFDRATGAAAWSAPLGTAAFTTLTYDQGRVFAVDVGGAASAPLLRAFDAASGALDWQVQPDPAQPVQTDTPLAYHGTLYTTGSGSAPGPTLYAYDEASGAVRWTAPFGGGTFAASSDGIFGFDGCGNTAALTLAGAPAWSQGTFGTCYPLGTAVVFGHGLYQLLPSPAVNAVLDTRTGTNIGTFAAEQGTPVFGAGIEIDIVGGALQATSMTSGAPAWTFVPEGDLAGPALVVGGTVYVASAIGNLYALDAATGHVAWSENTGAPFSQFYGLAAAHGVLVMPVDTALVAYGPAGAGATPEVHHYGGQAGCPWTLAHDPAPLGATTPTAMAVADLNEDGKPDIVVGETSPFGGGGLNVFLGGGDGTFRSLLETASFGGGTAALAVADVDGDGVPDVVSASGNDAFDGNPNVKVSLGKGDGTFQAGASYTVAMGPEALALGDLDGNGRPDLVVTDYMQGASVLLDQGKGTFGRPTTYGSGEVRSVALGDVNGDGKTDMLLGETTTPGVEVYLGKGNGTFGAPARLSLDGWPLTLSLADVNADGKADLLVATGAVEVSLGNGDGTFAAPTTYQAGASVAALAVGDVDLDGIADVVATNTFVGSVRILFGKGDGTFQGQVAFATGMYPVLVSIADFDGDGKPDVVTGNQTGNSLTVLLGACGAAP